MARSLPVGAVSQHFTAVAGSTKLLGELLGASATLCRLGSPRGALGRLDDGREHLRRVLRMAGEMRATPLVLRALAGVGVVLVGEGPDRERAELVVLALGREAMPATYRQVAQLALDELEAGLSWAEMAGAHRASAAAGLERDSDRPRRSLCARRRL